MGLLSRLFGRVQEDPVARPAPPVREPDPVEAGHTPPAPEPEPAAASEPEPSAPEPEPVAAPPAPEPEPVAGPEPEPAATPVPVGAGHAPPAPDPEPEETGPPAELSLTLEEAIAALRAAGSDGIRVGFLSREYLRAADEERPGARRRLVELFTEQLRARGLLADDGRFELRDEPTLAGAARR